MKKVNVDELPMKKFTTITVTKQNYRILWAK